MTAGKRIRKRRQELELTQQDVAQALGLTPQHISAIEQDKRTPSMSLLGRLAAELGVTVDYLVTGKEGVGGDTIPAIKADKRLSLKSKKALVSLVEELYGEHDGGSRRE
jgi:transcriptional regulator with XRE-family HTH domain